MGYVPIGMPLNDEVLSSMSEQEKAFWLDFLEEATQLKEQLEAEGKPLVLTKELQEKLERAIAEFEGGQYCPVRQIMELFQPYTPDFQPDLV